MTILRKYGVAATVDFDLFEVDGIDFRIDGAHASGDTKLMKDEGVEANTTNGFTDEGQGYSIVLTATEMQAARLVIYVVDQTATKVWLDRTVIIETYGHASAQHAMDFDDAVRGGMTALPNAAADGAGGLPISDAGGLDLDTQLANTNEITVARMGALTDWINGGRLDLILDIIAADVDGLNGDAMRGTNNALLAADAPTNFDVMSISATTGLVDITQVAADKAWSTTVRALTDKTGFGVNSLAVNTIDAASIAAAAMNGKGDWNIGKTGYLISGGITTLDGLNNFNPTLDTVANVTAVATTAVNTDMVAEAPTSADNADAVWDEDATAHQTVGSFGQAIGDPGANTETMYDAVVTDAAGANIAADVIAVKAETAFILADTNELQTDDVPGLIGALNDLAASDVLTQVNAALDTAISELGVATPAAEPNIRTGLMLLYMALRNNLIVQTSGTDALEVHDNAGTKIASKLLTDDGSDYNEAKMT